MSAPLLLIEKHLTDTSAPYVEVWMKMSWYAVAEDLSTVNGQFARPSTKNRQVLCRQLGDFIIFVLSQAVGDLALCAGVSFVCVTLLDLPVL